MTIGVSLKAYFGRRQAATWFGEVAAQLRDHSALRDALVDVFVLPTYLQLGDAHDGLRGTGIAIGAQDVSAFEPGPYTGEITAAELAESDVRYAEVGHAERRRLFGVTDQDVTAKVAASLRHHITPVVCVGETASTDAAAAAAATVAQLTADLAGASAGPIVVAYEPVWAIGAAEPASPEHITTVTRGLRDALAADPARNGSQVIYGGSAGPGLLTRLGDDVDGLFLGRFAHDPSALAAVLDEAVTLAIRRRAA
ncbi:triose-phosphate isomerase [Microbacterium invictum]